MADLVGVVQQPPPITGALSNAPATITGEMSEASTLAAAMVQVALAQALFNRIYLGFI